MTGFSKISPHELPVLAKVCSENNDGDLNETLRDLETIDRGLLMISSQALMMRRSPSLRKQLDMLIELRGEPEGNGVQWDSARNRYTRTKQLKQ